MPQGGFYCFTGTKLFPLAAQFVDNLWLTAIQAKDVYFPWIPERRQHILRLTHMVFMPNHYRMGTREPGSQGHTSS
jgi:hypothetical protein